VKRESWIPPSTNINDFVGFAKESEVNYSKTSKIMYVTSGHARKKALSYFSAQGVRDWDFCDVLIMDEMHSGTVDNTVIINLWSIARASGNKVPRLSLMSATPIPLLLEPTPVNYAVTFRRFEVRKHYSAVPLITSEKKLYAATVKLVADLHRKEPLVSTFELVNYANHILVFASGSREVLTLIDEIKAELGSLTSYQLIPLYGALQEQEIKQAFSKTADNVRKIVIATNTAETSITIEDVGIIVDMMLEKRVETSQAGGKRLVTLPISKDSADQRAGRAGRTRPGDCYRMCSETEYEGLEAHRLPEIFRVPIYEIVAELLAAGLNPRLALPGVEEQRITHTIDLLRRLGLVSITDLGEQITDLGRFSARVQLSVRNATFLWSWWQKSLPLYLGVVIASVIDCYGPYFYIPNPRGQQSREQKQPQEVVDVSKLFGAYYGADDLETYLNMWQDVVVNVTKSDKMEDHYTPSANSLSRYCRAKSLNNRTVSELFRVIEHTVRQLRKYLGNTVEMGGFSESTALVDAARPILLVSYSDSLMLKEGKLYYNYTSQKVSALTRTSILFTKLPPALVSLASHETGQGISGRNSTNSIIDMAIVTTVDEKGQDIQLHRRIQRDRGRPFNTSVAPVPISTLANALALLGENTTVQTISAIAQEAAARANPWELLDSLPTFPPEVDPWQWLISTKPIVVSPLPQPQPGDTVVTPLALDNINVEVNVSREYRRWITVGKIIRTILEHTDRTATVHELISNWLMAQVALPGKDVDPVFSAGQLSDLLPINQWLVVELSKLGIADVTVLWKNIQLKVAQYLLLAKEGAQHLPVIDVEPSNGLIKIGSYSYFFPNDQYQQEVNLHSNSFRSLFQTYQQEDIVKVLLRYASCGYPLQTIHPSVGQWLVQIFQITQELATTPLTRVHPQVPFYSWFDITDRTFTSRGVWTNADLSNQSSLAILPALMTVVDNFTNWLKEQLVIVTGPVQVVLVSPVSVSNSISMLPGVIGQGRFSAGSLLITRQQDFIPNPEDYLVTVVRIGEMSSSWPTPVVDAIQALKVVDGIGSSNQYKAVIKPSLESQNTSELLVKEYTRYQTIIVPLKNIILQDFLKAKAPQTDVGVYVNTTYGLFENWLITLANDANPGQADPIFSLEALDPSYPATAKQIQQLSKERLQYPDIVGLFEKLKVLVSTYLQNPLASPPPQIIRDGNILTIGDYGTESRPGYSPYTRQFPDGRLDILLEKANLVAVAAMTMREACLMPRGRQYTQPLAVTKYYVEKCGINLEGFATPINAQILTVDPNLWFCSLFPDTDGPFGSLGSFFHSNFSTARMTIYPPFIEAVVNNTARHLAEMFENGTELFAIITVPDWTDAEYYPILIKSKFFKHTFTIKRFENYSEDLRGRAKLNKVDDLVVIWNKGYPDLNWKDIEKNVLEIHKKGVQKLNKAGAALKRK